MAPGKTGGHFLQTLQYPADALLGQMIFLAQFPHCNTFGIRSAYPVIPRLQFSFIGRFMPPGMSVPRLTRDIDIYTVHMVLDLPDQFLRQDLLCFYIAHGCLLMKCSSPEAQ